MDDTTSLPVAALLSPHTHTHTTAATVPASLPPTPSILSPLPQPPQLTAGTRWMDVWPGHHTFWCGGRLVIGSNPLLFLVTLALQLASLTLFAVCIALPAYPLYYSLPVCVLFPPLFCSFLAASLSDPGILPPLASFVPPVPTQLDIDGQTRKWCVYCRLWRARRAKHCKYCHVCVDEFDHHWSGHPLHTPTSNAARPQPALPVTRLHSLTCALIAVCCVAGSPWIGNCVGKRNYRYYCAFITLLTLLAPYMATISVWYVVDTVEAHGARGLWRQWRAAVAVLLSLFFVLVSLFSLSLTLFHLQLLFTGQTTNEQVRRVWQHQPSTYHRGCWGNTVRVCVEGSSPSTVTDWVGERVGGLERMATEERQRWEQGEQWRAEREERDRVMADAYLQKQRGVEDGRKTRDELSSGIVEQGRSEYQQRLLER